MLCLPSIRENSRPINICSVFIHFFIKLGMLCLPIMHENSRPINRKKGKATNPNNSFFSEKKKELLGWDSNPRHTAC